MSDPTLVEFLATVKAFSAFDQHELEQLAVLAESEMYDFGSTILEAGDSVQKLAVIKSGRVRLFTQQRDKERSVGIRKAGDTFGEISILNEQPLDYSVRASGKTEILFFSFDAIASLMDKNEAARSFMTGYIALMVTGGLITRLFDLRGKVDRAELENIVQSIGVKRVQAKQTLLSQDSSEDRRLYVVQKGEVNIVRKEEGTDYNLITLGPGEVFGEKACLTYSTQQTTAISNVETVLIVVPQETVHSILQWNPSLRTILEERINFTERELNRQQKLAELRKKPFLFDIRSKPKPGERIIRRFALMEQAEAMDCGATCLAMICRHFDIPITLGKLREMANVTMEGATMGSLARVGESLGFVTKGVRCTYDAMLGFDLPFIAHWEGLMWFN